MFFNMTDEILHKRGHTINLILQLAIFAQEYVISNYACFVWECSDIHLQREQWEHRARHFQP